MIIHKNLSQDALQRTIDISSDERLNLFLKYVSQNKKMSTGFYLNKIEIDEMISILRNRRIPASCFYWDGTPPSILLHQPGVKIKGPIWKHERLHFQLLNLRRMTGSASCTFLILHLLNKIPKKNLKIFFKATINRYSHLLKGEAASPPSRLRFLEELLNAALTDYKIDPIPDDCLNLIDRKLHAETLIKVRSFIRGHSSRGQLPTAFGVWDTIITRIRSRYIGEYYYNIIAATLLEPDADFFVT